MRLLAAVAAGYLAGSVPSADLAVRAAGGTVDLRATGTGNPGAVNAMAVLGPAWGYGILAVDIAKGALACAAGRRLAGTAGAHAAGTAAVVGHCYPVWSRFRGGRGVAPSVGQCLATFPVYLPADVGIAWFTALRTRRRHTFTATAVASSAWVAAALVWWRRRWPNLWGPTPTAGLPAAAAASSAVIMARFAAAARRPGVHAAR